MVAEGANLIEAKALQAYALATKSLEIAPVKYPLPLKIPVFTHYVMAVSNEVPKAGLINSRIVPCVIAAVSPQFAERSDWRKTKCYCANTWLPNATLEVWQA
jgi:hypothetical protein